MKNIFYFIFFILVLAVGLVFTIYNSGNVVFDYVIDSVELPLSLIVIIAIIAGAFLGLLSCSIIIVRMRNELALIKKNQRKIEQE